MSDKEKRENLAMIPSLEKSESITLGSELFSEGQWPAPDWWTSFDSPTLTSWIETGFEKNPNLQSVKSWLEQAAQVAQVSRATLYPTLFFNASDNYRYLSEHEFFHVLNPALPLGASEIDLSLAFNYEFDFWHKYRNEFRAAVGEAMSREAEYQQARLILSTSLAQSYFAIATTMQKKALYEEIYVVQMERLRLQELMKESALFDAFAPLFSDEKVQETKQTIVGLHDEIVIQTHLINILMGKGPDQELVLGGELKSPPKTLPLPKDISLGLLSRRPDLMAQIWKADSMAAQVGVARAIFFPNINLAAFAGLKSIGISDLFLSSSKTFGYRPTLSLPMYTAGSIRANVRAKQAAFNQAIYEYNELLLKSTQEVADLLSQVETVYKQQELQGNIVNDSKTRLELTLLRQDGGLDSQFSYLDFQQNLLEKKVAQIDLTYAQFAFVIKLIKALGGGYIAPTVPIKAEES